MVAGRVGRVGFGVAKVACGPSVGVGLKLRGGGCAWPQRCCLLSVGSPMSLRACDGGVRVRPGAWVQLLMRQCVLLVRADHGFGKTCVCATIKLSDD